MATCPICGRHLGTFTDDPLLVTPSLSTEENRGFIHLISTHIEELQIERHQQEIDNGVTPLTEFTVIDDSRLFQNIKQYILELRDSTQKIMDITGQTLQEFLSTDEDGNPTTPKNDWTDPNIEEIKFQCKAIHIEDLRHFVQEAWIETYTDSRIEPSDPTSAIDYSLETDQDIFHFPPYNVIYHYYNLPDKTLYADKKWYIHGELKVYHDFNFQYSKGNISDNWNGVGVFNHSIGISNFYSSIHLEGYISFWSKVVTTLYAGLQEIPYKCRNNLRLELGTGSFSVNANPGNKVIIHPYYQDNPPWGSWHDTNAELSASMAAMSCGGTVEIRVIFGGVSVSFYRMGGQHISVPAHGVLWNPDERNGMYIYDAIVSSWSYPYPPPTPEQFATYYYITEIHIYSSGRIASTWNGWWRDLFSPVVEGYTVNGNVHVDYTLDDIRLVSRIP